jgi:1-acyl-sn-glycerol-3-phosphate acyltransferase
MPASDRGATRRKKAAPATSGRARRKKAAPAAPPADPFGYDPAMHERMRPLLRFLYERYWRVKVEGIENVPARGAALIVANHSGTIPIDASMLAAAMEFAAPQPRLLRFLFDRFVSAMPLVGDFYRKVGSVPASYDNALVLLRQGDLVGIFPEGVAGVAKGFARRYRLEEFRSGFVSLSLEARVPIIPAAVVGAEEAYPLIGKWKNLGPLKELLNVPYLPMTPLFPWFGLLGVIPLPSRWEIRFGEPIHFYEDLRHLDIRPRTSKLLAQDVRRQIQGMVHELLAGRDGLFVAPRPRRPGKSAA